MRPQTIMAAVLLGFVGLSLAVLVVKEFRGPESPAVGDLDVDVRAASRPVHVIVYCFGTSQRCATCDKIQAWSHEAIQQGFAGQLKDGRLLWRVVNYEGAQNRHFVQAYGLYTKSLVLVDVRDGREVRFKQLKEVWDLLNDKEAFQRYVREQVGAYLGAADG